MNLLVSQHEIEQPPVVSFKDKNELTAVIASLSIGGAERIVIDWATRVHPTWNVHLIVLRDREKEWPVPSFIKVTRIGDPRNRTEKLRLLGKEIAAKHIPVGVCHLLSKQERDTLAENGASIVAVLHNAKDGWPEDVSCLLGSTQIIAVSEACARDLKESGWSGPVSVIRHIPSRPRFAVDAKEKFRKAWNIPDNSIVIGMIGAIKPQKNYNFALEILKTLHKKLDAYLVVLGGPIGANARANWEAVVGEVYRLGLRHRVAMPGFVPNAASCLPAFDVMLNTSHFEGLSMATLEALQGGIPIVASEVGGQGELQCDGLTLLPKDACIEDWVSALEKKIYSSKFEIPSWSRFPAFRLWTLASLARPVKSSGKVLFVTANLNSGGAQRSLVNLAKSLGDQLWFEVVVTGNSTASYFYHELRKAGVEVTRAAVSWDAFSYAEALVHKICTEEIGTVCFWNLDSRIKLLVVKTLGFTATRFIDVSPGDYLFEEMDGTEEFQRLIVFTKEEYFRRLDQLVLKYHGSPSVECKDKIAIIPNGVPDPPMVKGEYTIQGIPRVAVSGRIAPSKFVLEIIGAVRLLWEKIPSTELHFFGAAEPTHRDYAKKVFEAAEDEVGKKIFFHGHDFQVISRLPELDAYVVLGKNQGCPNSLLEALAVGLPAIANNDGGTSEQLIHNQTGLLVDSCSPKELAGALFQILTDRNLAKRLGQTGREHVLKNFSMSQMTQQYLGLLK